MDRLFPDVEDRATSLRFDDPSAHQGFIQAIENPPNVRKPSSFSLVMAWENKSDKNRLKKLEKSPPPMFNNWNGGHKNAFNLQFSDEREKSKI